MQKIILLDLDDTLLDFKKAEAAAISKTLKEFHLDSTEAVVSRYSAINASQWELLEAGVLTREQVLTRRFEILFEELEAKGDIGKVRDTYEGYLGKGHYFIPGAPEVLNILWERYRLYLVSNGTASVQAGRLESAEIGRFFQDIFISQEIGCDKPNVEFFRRCFERIPDFSREDTIIVGDSLTSDIQGGINAGIKTCWFNYRQKPGREDIRADYEITDLLHLPELLMQVFEE